MDNTGAGSMKEPRTSYTTSLCTAWMDHEKVYNSMPHRWRLERLKHLQDIKRLLCGDQLRAHYLHCCSAESWTSSDRSSRRVATDTGSKVDSPPLLVLKDIDLLIYITRIYSSNIRGSDWTVVVRTARFELPEGITDVQDQESETGPERNRQFSFSIRVY